MQWSNELSESEIRFRQKRSHITMTAIQNVLRCRGPKSMEETPTVALAISGGGYRAVSASCGATEALMENGIFDALMYCVGLSGSVWYFSSTYCKKSFSSLEQLKKDHDWIRGQLGIKFDFNPWMIAKSLVIKRKVSLADIFGTQLRDILLDSEHKNSKLSSLQAYVEDASVPFPIFSAAHVMNNYPVIDFWEEVELTPFEATHAAYRLLIPIEHVDSMWDNGELSNPRDEPKLHYVMAICGCAFAILLYHIGDENEHREKNFWNSWKDMLRGIWNSAKGVFLKSNAMQLPGAVLQSSAPLTIMSEEEFRDTVWDPVLSKLLAEEGEDVDPSDAYLTYIDYMESDEDREWVSEIIDVVQQKPTVTKSTVLGGSVDGKMSMMPKLLLSKENLGRNVGRLKRTGFLRNPFYNMSDGITKYMMNDQPVTERKPDSTKRIGMKASTKNKQMLVVDAGLGCNVPVIHVTRPKRKVDIILVADCETKTADKESEDLLGTLTTLQKQMIDNNMKFPKIDIQKLKEDPEQEYYLFEDTDEPDCPIVIWFTLYNKRFKTLLNAPRSDQYLAGDADDSKFNDFDVTPDRKEYSTTNLQYSPRDVDRLRELMRHNIGENIEVVKEKLAHKVIHLRSKTKIE